MSNSIVKAVRAMIYLGHIPLEIFRLPDGEYRLSQTQIAEAVEKEEISVRRFLKSESLELLPYKGFAPDKIAVESSKTRINSIPILVAIAYWTKEAIAGNAVAARLLGACASESIERRADAAFGIQYSEEERQAFMEARIKGKQTRRCLTDAIASYIVHHPELSENDKKWLYNNASDAVNLQVFNRRANRLCKDLKADKSNLRDALTPKIIRESGSPVFLKRGGT